MHYKWKTGMWAFVLHRVTGIGLSIYLIMHLYVVSSLHSAENFDAVMGFLNLPLFKLLEIGLLFAVIYHALNGVRVFLIDFTNSTKSHAKIWWVLAVVGFVIFVFGAIPFLHHGGVL